MTFAEAERRTQRKTTKKEIFLKEMERILPWQEIIEVIRPYYYANTTGRPATPLEVMLRMYLVQVWFNLSDEKTEDELYDSHCIGKFCGINNVDNSPPDATTLLHFRRIIEENNLGKEIFEKVNDILEEKEWMMRGGTIIDATIIQAPSSTKNRSGARDAEMSSVKKGSNYYFGMRVHIGSDAGSGLVHTVVAAPANQSEISHAHKLIREDDDVVWSDAGNAGLEKRDEITKNEVLSKKEYRISMRPGKRRKMKELGEAYKINELEEKRKTFVRNRVEFPFGLMKCKFGFRKTIYKGLAKNLNRIYMIFMNANLWLTRKMGEVYKRSELVRKQRPQIAW